jgi:hypothetical protein
VNGAVELISNYKKMSPDDIGLALLKLGWQGVMSGVGIRQAGGLGATFNPMAGARMLIAQHLPPPRIHYGSTEVAGNAVAIRLVNGRDYEIFAGPQADQARIDYHVAVARRLRGDMTFTEMLARSERDRARRGTPSPPTCTNSMGGSPGGRLSLSLHARMSALPFSMISRSACSAGTNWKKGCKRCATGLPPISAVSPSSSRIQPDQALRQQVRQGNS